MNKVYATAVSFLSPLGNDLDVLAHALKENKSGVRFFHQSEIPTDFPVRYGARLDSIAGNSLNQNRDPDFNPAALAAAWLAEDMAKKIQPGIEIDAFGFFRRDSNSFGLTVEIIKKNSPGLPSCKILDKKIPQKIISDFLKREKNISIEKTFFLGSTCTSGNVLLGTAFQRIRAGEWQRALVGTIEIENGPFQLMGLHLLGALSTGFTRAEEASRPFAAGRNGFVKGESACLILLESEEAMKERGASSLGEISGYSNTSDSWRFAEGHPEGRELIAAMRLALADAATEPEAIDYIKAHATSTPTGDKIELQAIKQVFGGKLAQIPISAPKSQLGHSTASCATMEFIATLAMMKHQFISPNLNLEVIDPAIGAEGVNLVGPRSIPARIRRALLNSGGFGGLNSCLVVNSSEPA